LQSLTAAANSVKGFHFFSRYRPIKEKNDPKTVSRSVRSSDRAEILAPAIVDI
jgi:hypothetical protein